MKRSYPVRRGFTLIELLVVVSILGVLALLTLNAVQAVRERCRGLQCRHNLRQIGLALHSYHITNICFPPGRIKTFDPRFSGDNPPCTSVIVDKSILVCLLPYIEQLPLYNAINQTTTILGAENRTVHSVQIPAYLCPSDASASGVRELPPNALADYDVRLDDFGAPTMLFSNYEGSVGSLFVNAFKMPDQKCVVRAETIAQSDGAFNDVSPITLAMFTDGLANTMMFSERANGSLHTLNSVGTSEALRHGWYLTGNWGDTLFTACFPPNMHRRRIISPPRVMILSASSFHEGGVNVLFGDGSVRFISDSVDSWSLVPGAGLPLGMIQRPEGFWVNIPSRGIWQKLATRSGGEIVEVGPF